MGTCITSRCTFRLKAQGRSGSHSVSGQYGEKGCSLSSRPPLPSPHYLVRCTQYMPLPSYKTLILHTTLYSYKILDP